MLSKQLLLILAVVFTITANNADAAMIRGSSSIAAEEGRALKSSDSSIAAEDRRALTGKKSKDNKKKRSWIWKQQKDKKFSIEKKGDKKTCSEWVGQDGNLCEDNKKVKKNCGESCSSLPLGSIIDIASSNRYKKTLGTWDELLGDFDLKDQLSQPGAYTVFAPTNEAFQQAGICRNSSIGTREGVIDNEFNSINGSTLKCSYCECLPPDQLLSVLNYHVVKGVYPESVLVDGVTLTTLQGEKIRFRNITAEQPWSVNDATIITPSILTNNGIIYGTDGVLVPLEKGVLIYQWNHHGQ